MLIDEIIPEFGYRTAVHTIVDADPATTFAALDSADLSCDPVVTLLVGVRDLPNRVVGWWRGERVERAQGRVTFGEMSEAPPWVDLGEVPGREKVAGAVGRFWRRDYGWRELTPGDFRRFAEPGFAKTVAGFSVRPYGEHRTLLTMESRTATIGPEADAQFRRYWLVLKPFVNVLMSRGIACVKREAERLARGEEDRTVPMPAAHHDVARAG